MAVSRVGGIDGTEFSAGTTSWAVGVDSGDYAVDRLRIIWLAADDDDVVFTAPDGSWNKVISDINSGNTAMTLSVFWKKLVSGDSGVTSYTFTSNTSEVGYAYSATYSGQDTTTPMDASAVPSDSAGGTASSPVTTGITTVTNDALLVGAICANATSVTVTATPSPLTEVVENSLQQHICISEGTQVTAGATGNLTYTFSSSNPWLAGLLAIRPASGAGTQDVEPTLLTNSQTFYVPTITTGAVSVAPDLLTNTQTIYVPAVVNEGGTQDVEPLLVENTQTFYAPTLTPGNVNVAPTLLTNSQTFYAPTLTPGEATVAPDLLTNTQTFYTPSFTFGGVTISPSLLTNTQTFYAPVVGEVEAADAHPITGSVPVQAATGAVPAQSFTGSVPTYAVTGSSA